ncbi:hypothetical protein [Microbispora sp. NPDC049125]|uniref:hypothetical protein n=1 Tax=Microbispora sp. NPDC049125 TaxID=3154929 RepID=UPI003465610D
MRSTAVAAAVSACALLAAGCSVPGEERGFTPAGVVAGQRSGGSQPAPAPSVETVAVAPGLTVQIEWPEALEPAHTAMVKALTGTYTAQWRAVGSLGEDESYLGAVEDAASRDAYTWVHGFVSEKLSARGVAKIYGLRVASVSGRGAEVDACVEESGVRVTDKNGDPIAEQPLWTKPPRSTYLQVAAVRKGDDGAWRVKLFQHAAYPDERAKECVR